MRYTEKNAAGKSVSNDIPFSMLSPEGQKRYKELQKKIQEFSSGLSISPIDVIKNKMEAAGYRVGEMTGRNYEIRMNEHGQLVKMRRVDTEEKKTARECNPGQLDAVILNK